MVSLKSCPFCNSQYIQLKTDERYFYVECDICDARGPKTYNMGLAITGWNDRLFYNKNDK